MLARSRIAVVMGTTLMAAWFSGPAAAQAPRGGGDPREITEAGRRAYNLGRWPEAIEAFERSYQLTGDPALLFNLAQAHRQLDHVVEALRLYKTYLRERPDGPDRVVAEQQIVELERRRRTAPPAAPAPASTTPPRPGGLATPLQPSPATPPAPPVVVAPPQVTPAIAVTEPAPAVAPPAVPPPPVVATTAPAAVATAPLVGAQTTPQPPLPRWLPWAGAAVTAALATAATVVGLSSNERFDALASTCGQTALGCSDSEIASVRSKTRTANLLWMGAAITAAATGVTVYVNTREAGMSGLVRF